MVFNYLYIESIDLLQVWINNITFLLKTDNLYVHNLIIFINVLFFFLKGYFFMFQIKMN